MKKTRKDPARPYVFVKFGGSLLTNKGEAGRPEFRRSLARRLLRELEDPPGPLILVHGAGSFGHPQAKRHRIGASKLSGARLREAIQEVQTVVGRLRAAIAEEASSVGVPLVPIPAPSVASFDGSRLRIETSAFQRWSEAGFIPFTGGDVLLDPQSGARVASGDALLVALAQRLAPQRVVFATDVDGVLVDGAVARTLDVAKAVALLPRIQPGSDATGGMRGKLEAAIRLANLGVDVWIVNGRSPGRLRAAILGKRPTGTRISGPSLGPPEGPRPQRSPIGRRG